jgi:hypothetical protein
METPIVGDRKVRLVELRGARARTADERLVGPESDATGGACLGARQIAPVDGDVAEFVADDCAILIPYPRSDVKRFVVEVG